MLDDEFFEDEFEQFDEDLELLQEAVRAYDCRCGAMRLTEDGPIQGADCVC